MSKSTIIKNLKQQPEMDHDKHDGSYRVVRETVKCLSNIELEQIDIVDLNMLYLMTVGTWKSSFDNKRKQINNSNLKSKDKQYLLEIVNDSEKKAESNYFGNHENNDNDHMGMFGSGFMSFAGKSNKEEAQYFIDFDLSIHKLNDEDEIISIATKKLNRKIKGLGAASASQILHCLKPTVFPILNAVGGEFYKNILKLEIEDPGNLSEYISNCKKIKELRDANFKFKNYRIMDLIAIGGEMPETTGGHKKNNYDNNHQTSLNTILYGPPGTGKTYSTIAKAIGIANPFFTLPSEPHSPEGRKIVKDEYQRLYDEGKIVFTSFHQSLSYEDFIEGIKPEISDGAAGTSSDEDNSGISYVIEPGIFRQISEAAGQKKKIRSKYNFDENKIEFNKMSLGNTQKDDDDIFGYCIENNVIALGYGDSIDYSSISSKEKIKDAITEKNRNAKKFSWEAVDRFKNVMKIDDIVLISKGNKYIRAIGRVTGDYFFDKSTSIRYNHFRNVEWLYTDTLIPISQILNEKNLSQQTIYQFYKKDINIGYIKNLLSFTDEEKNQEKYVLIIDEINRGNVSQIFGELITLLEEDKRAGNMEELEVILPYSKERFSVPANLHIIGTMNTADRSVEALDTALRRRFSFEFMPPDPQCVPENLPDNDLPLREIYILINERIKYLLDADHQIGHSYFMNIESEDHLKDVFKNKIIPLLKEYFYNDYGKIRLILGDQFVQKIELPSFPFESDEIERELYDLKPIDENFNIIEALTSSLSGQSGYRN